jgi:hypothetical protein
MKSLRFVKGTEEIGYVHVEQTHRGWAASTTLVLSGGGLLTVGGQKRVFATESEAECWAMRLCLSFVQDGYVNSAEVLHECHPMD